MAVELVLFLIFDKCEDMKGKNLDIGLIIFLAKFVVNLKDSAYFLK